MFNATFNNSSVSGENHRTTASHWQTLSHTIVSSTPRHTRDSNSQPVITIVKDCSYNRNVSSTTRLRWDFRAQNRSALKSKNRTNINETDNKKRGNEIMCSKRVSLICPIYYDSQKVTIPGTKSRKYGAIHKIISETCLQTDNFGFFFPYSDKNSCKCRYTLIFMQNHMVCFICNTPYNWIICKCKRQFASCNPLGFFSLILVLLRVFVLHQ
jgi:hypothetical protein